jgi:hypothetical protein
MGGGMLDLRFSAGGLYAYFTAYADFFIVWSPFYFIADMGVSVGAGYRGKWWFVNVDISVHVSAKLHLEGPPFSGVVKIDIGITVIDIYFGQPPGPPPALRLDEFWELLLSSPGNGPGESDKAGITLAIESGSLPGENHKVATDSTNQSWAVSPGGFIFLVQCRFALQEVIYDKTQVIPKQGGDIYQVFSRPMHSTQSITSILTITVTRDKQKEGENEVVEFTCKPIWKKVPSAQWGKCEF